MFEGGEGPNLGHGLEPVPFRIEGQSQQLGRGFGAGGAGCLPAYSLYGTGLTRTSSLCAGTVVSILVL